MYSPRDTHDTLGRQADEVIIIDLLDEEDDVAGENDYDIIDLCSKESHDRDDNDPNHPNTNHNTNHDRSSTSSARTPLPSVSYLNAINHIRQKSEDQESDTSSLTIEDSSLCTQEKFDANNFANISNVDATKFKVQYDEDNCTHSDTSRRQSESVDDVKSVALTNESLYSSSGEKGERKKQHEDIQSITREIGLPKGDGQVLNEIIPKSNFCDNFQTYEKLPMEKSNFEQQIKIQQKYQTRAPVLISGKRRLLGSLVPSCIKNEEDIGSNNSQRSSFSMSKSSKQFIRKSIRCPVSSLPSSSMLSCIELKTFLDLFHEMEKRIPPSAEYCHGELLAHFEKHGKLTIGEAEGNRVRKDNRTAQYGSFTPIGVKKLIDILQIQYSDVVLDIGHGSGRVVLQIAATTMCQEARGIEIVRERHEIAACFYTRFTRYLRALGTYDSFLSRFEKNITLEVGDLKDKSFWRNFFGEATCIIVNNYNGIFNGRRGGGVVGSYSLDDHVASIFASSKVGTRMITLEKLYILGDDVTTKNEGLKPGDEGYNRNLSFFTCQEMDLGSCGSEVVSWGSDSLVVKIFIYTRTEQDFDHATWTAPSHRNCCPTAAINEENLMINDTCVYCDGPIETRNKRSRKL